LGLDFSSALCGGTRDPTEEATVKNSMNDENTILCETGNGELLKETRCLAAKQAPKDLICSLSVRSTSSCHLPVSQASSPRIPSK
jgi:hypothetical protein